MMRPMRVGSTYHDDHFRALSAAEQQALSLAVRHYQAFLGKPIVLAETKHDHRSTL